MIFEKKNKIFLIGFMGSGKSTLGKRIARAMHYDFIDLDTSIEVFAADTISSLFQTKGEEGFREIETECLSHLIDKKYLVIATGGGTPCFYNNMEVMLEHGCCVYLKMPEGALVQRLLQASPKRPLLAGKSEEELRVFIHEMLLKREEIYQKCHLVMDGMTLNTASIVGVLKHKMMPKPSIK